MKQFREQMFLFAEYKLQVSCASKLEFDKFCRLYASSFFKKGDISAHFHDEHRYNDLVETLQNTWQTYFDESLSFIVKDRDDRMVGLCLNKRFRFDPTEKCTHPRPFSQTAYIDAFAHFMYSQIM